MPNPWEEYQTTVPVEDGPWTKYPTVETGWSDQQLGETFGQSGQMNLEPTPFPIDTYVNEEVKDLPSEERAKARDGWAVALNSMMRPVKLNYYSVSAGLSEGMAHFYGTLDLFTSSMERHYGLSSGGLFGAWEKQGKESAAYYEKLIEKEGINGFDKFIHSFVTKPIGSAFPTITEFALSVASGLTIPFIAGEEEAHETGDVDPFIGGLVEAAKTGMLAGVFKMVQPFSRYIQATVFGTGFGVQGFIEAEPGKKLESLAGGVVSGVGMAAISPRGKIGIREAARALYPKVVPVSPDMLRRLGVEGEKASGDKILRPANKEGDKVVIAEPGETRVELEQRTKKVPVAEVDNVDTIISKLPEGDWVVPEGTIVHRGEGKENEGGNWYGDESSAKNFALMRGEDGKVTSIDISGKKLADAERYLKDPDELGNRDFGSRLKPEEVAALLERALKDGYDGIYSRKTRAALLPNEAQAKTFGLQRKVVSPDATTGPVSKIPPGKEGTTELSKVETQEQGFSPDGKTFLNREQAKEYLKENDPEIYAAWQEIAGPDAEFHTADYNKVREKLADKATQDVELADLTAQLRDLPEDTSFEDKQTFAEKTQRIYTGVLGKAKTVFVSLKANTVASWDWYKNHAVKFTTLDELLNGYTGARQINGMKAARFAKGIQEGISEREQNAMAIWLEAAGDVATIEKWSREPKLKKASEDALRLSDEHKAFALKIRDYWGSVADKAIEAGILSHGIENYVMHLVERKGSDNHAVRRLLADSNAGVLRKDPSFAKKRIYETFFDLTQAGFDIKDMRIGSLVTKWQASFDEALNARSFIKKLSELNAANDDPMVITLGSGTPLKTGEADALYIPPTEAWLIKPRAVTEKQRADLDLSNYRLLEHPALKRWKWVSSTENGTPIFVEGDLLIHKEAYSKVKNLLGKSWFQGEGVGPAVGRVLLKGSAEIKGTLLGFFSGFHQAHIGWRLGTRKISPFSEATINLEDPLTLKLISRGGLIVYDNRAMSAFYDGLAGPGLTRFIPYIGKYAAKFTEATFGLDGWIPRKKVQLAKEFYTRNRERYPELSDDQVLKLSAEQANAAIGAQNWTAMGASKTTQDLLSLSCLAPDFLISSWRAKGQALAPYGREQLTAIAVRGTLGMYILAKTIEGVASMIDDKNKVHLDRPFSATVDGKEYTLRSEQGDIWNLIRDPRSFVYYRLNPGILKPAIEALTGRDNFGRKRDTVEQLMDWATASVPMAGQGFFTREDYTLYQAMMQSYGVGSWDSRTAAEQLTREILSEKSKTEAEPETKERIQLRLKLFKDYRDTGDFIPISKALAEGKIIPRDITNILNRFIKSDIERGVQEFSVAETLKVWDKANEEEKTSLQLILAKKWFTWQATVDERSPFEDQMTKVLYWKPSDKGESENSFLRRFVVGEK